MDTTHDGDHAAGDTPGDELCQTVWLLAGRLDPFPVPAELALSGRVLSLTLAIGAADAVLGWVAQRLATTADSLVAELTAGRQVTVFRTSDFTVNWPRTFAGTAMEIHVGRHDWLMCLSCPTGGAISQTVHLITGRSRSKAWKLAFAELTAA